MILRKTRVLTIVISSAILAGLIYVYITVPGDNGWLNSWKTMGSAQYVKDMLQDAWRASPETLPVFDGKVGDKVIVMAHLPDEDVSWVELKLPDWQRAIYTVPENTVLTAVPTVATTPPKELTLPANKGHEAMAYITYLIDFYNDFPEIILFLHPHENGYTKAWHVDARLHSNVVATRELRLDHVRERGYVNMRCNPRSNCLHLPQNYHPVLITPPVWEAFWQNTSTPVPIINKLLEERVNIDDADDENKTPDTLDLGTTPYPPIADPSGAQFAITRDVARKRPRADYVAFRDWLIATDLPDETSGRIFEYTWHIFFGMPGVLCYERRKCECEVYGRC